MYFIQHIVIIFIQNTLFCFVFIKICYQPAYYQPAPASVYNSQPSAPFTSFAEVQSLDILLTISVTIIDNQVNGKFAEVENKQAPVAAVIETAAEKGGDDDGEVGWRIVFSPQLFHVCSVFLMLLCPKVFYIFYENEETLDKGVKSGLDLQRYIHEEVLKLRYHHHHCHHRHHHHHHHHHQHHHHHH